MANVREGNCQFVDTSAAFTDIKNIKSIKYIGAASGTATIKGGGTSSGDVMWEESGSTNTWNDDLGLRDCEGIYVTLTNSAKVYIYYP